MRPGRARCAPVSGCRRCGRGHREQEREQHSPLAGAHDPDEDPGTATTGMAMIAVRTAMTIENFGGLAMLRSSAAAVAEYTVTIAGVSMQSDPRQPRPEPGRAPRG